jgi:HAD superfamily hydrolase (TIGR01509 family)
MKFDGIIFDFNGVLWWDSHLHEYAWKQFSEAVGSRSFSSEEIRAHALGRTNQYCLTYLMGRPVTGDDLEQLTQQKETIYRQLCLKQGTDFKLSPGAIELLDYLVARDIPHTIATGSEKTNLDFFVEHFLLRKWFNLTQIVYDDGSRLGKPAPDMYLEAARRIELEPTQCVVVEDSPSGIEAAYEAAIGHIVALGPADTHHRLTKLKGVNRVVETLEEIPKEQLFQAM